MSGLKEVGGWTPVIDSLRKKYGRTAAMVYGTVWRIAEWNRERICDKPYSYIAKLAACSYSTVIREVHRLIEAGYLEDVDHDNPEVKAARNGLSLRLRCTTKIRFSIVAIHEEELDDDPAIR